MEILDLSKLGYKTKACLIVGEELKFEEIGLSWLKADEKYIVKTIAKSKNKYSFSIKVSIKGKSSDVTRYFDENIEWYIGCIDEVNTIYQLKISNITIKPSAGNNLNLFLIIDENFKVSGNSHISCEIELKKIEGINFSTWENFQNNEDRINSLCTPERINCFKEENFDFRKWYEDEVKICCYCGVKEEDLREYFNDKNPQYFIDKDNKARQRGKYLEIERLQTVGEKNKYFHDNTRLACYVCNNAKSDFLSPKSFKPIAEGINIFWNNVLSGDDKVEFPKDSKIWNLD